MDLFSFEGARRIGPENVLVKVSAPVDWGRIGAVLDPAKLRSGLGAQGYDLLLLFKCLLLGQWHGLSDPKLEESLKASLDFMLLAGLDLHAPAPDETTHCRFQNALVEKDGYDDLLAEICRQLEEHGLKLREAEAAIIYATLIASAARPRSHVGPKSGALPLTGPKTRRRLTRRHTPWRRSGCHLGQEGPQEHAGLQGFRPRR